MPKSKPRELILEGDPRLAGIDRDELSGWLDRALINAPPLSKEERQALARSLARRRDRLRTNADRRGAA